jgi:hypothetical protein
LRQIILNPRSVAVEYRRHMPTGKAFTDRGAPYRRSSGGFSMGGLASVVDSTNFALGLGILVRHDVTSNTPVQVNGEQQEGH